LERRFRTYSKRGTDPGASYGDADPSAKAVPPPPRKKSRKALKE